MTILRNIIVWALTLCLAVIIVKSCLSRIFLDSNVERSLSVSPNYSEALIKKNSALINEIGQNNFSPADKKRITANAAKILQSAPLNDDALNHVALLDIAEPIEFTNADRLIIAKARNARNRNTLRQLLKFYLEQSMFDNVLEEVDLLLRLDKKNTDNYHAFLDAIYQTPGGKISIHDALNEKSSWGHSFLMRAIRAADADGIFTLQTPIERQISLDTEFTGNLPLVSAFVTELVTDGHLDFAYDYWRKSYPEYMDGFAFEDAAIFNPSFNDIDVARPFNWTVYNSASVSTEFDRSGGLFVSFNDSKPRFVARQFAKIAPDAVLEINHEARLKYKAQQGDFEWRVLCLQTNKRLVTLSALELAKTSPNEAKAYRLTNEENCAYIDVQLWGLPGVFKDRISMTVKSFNLTASQSGTRADIGDAP